MSSGDRLIALNAAHAAFRRDLARLAAAATPANLADPARRGSIMTGWTMFKAQLHIHHSAEDRFIWPRLRERLAGSDTAGSTLDAMDAEHALIDPLVAAVDSAFGAVPGDTAGPDVADVVGELVTRLTLHMDHEERDAMPMIDTALTDREWRAVVSGLHGMIKEIGTLTVADFVPWLTDGVPEHRARMIATILPPPLRPVYRRVWNPRYRRAVRW